MDCLETYHNDAITTTYRISPQGMHQACPKRMCEGRVFNIDDTILPSVILLNSKGYETHSSCGGHALGENQDLYIEFDEDVKSLPFIPEEFELRVRKGEETQRLRLIYTIKEIDPYDHFNELLAAAEILYEWALDLEPVYGTNIYLLNSDSLGSLSDFLSNAPKKAPSKEEAIQKIKEIAPDGSIELEGIDFKKEEPTPEPKQKEEPTPEPEQIEKQKRKRGRPKKEKE